ncbi:Uncharacterised protein [uncultured archaeon]|nr:Uncharacterised protein [uncultured archaeon]
MEKGGTFLAALVLKKRGSHVGMILSFLIFITFVVFLYVVLKPGISTGQDKKTIVQYIENKIVENTSANLTSTSIVINSTQNPGDKCVIFGGFLLMISGEIPTANIVIKNETGNLQNSSVYATDLEINRAGIDNLFFKIYYSPEFDLLNLGLGPPDCSPITNLNYSVGIIKVDDYAFEKKFYQLIDYYNQSYDDLKRGWNIPPGNEFTFSFVQNNGTKIGIDQNISSTEIYSDEVPIQYVDNNANIQGGFIDVKVW